MLVPLIGSVFVPVCRVFDLGFVTAPVVEVQGGMLVFAMGQPGAHVRVLFLGLVLGVEQVLVEELAGCYHSGYFIGAARVQGYIIIV